MLHASTRINTLPQDTPQDGSAALKTCTSLGHKDIFTGAKPVNKVLSLQHKQVTGPHVGLPQPTAPYIALPLYLML